MRIYVCHPYADDPEKNLAEMRGICRAIALDGATPVCPPLMYRGVLDEGEDREVALRCCLDLIAGCDAVVVFGEPSPGMTAEIQEAHRLGVPVTRTWGSP